MRAIFLGRIKKTQFLLRFVKFSFYILKARGPDFKKQSKIGPIKTVDVYPLLCDLLKIQCNPNNGTITPFNEARNIAYKASKSSCFVQIILASLLFLIK